MALSVWFWILWLLGLLLGLYGHYAPGQPYPYARGGGWLLLFVLLFILGMGVFGGPVK